MAVVELQRHMRYCINRDGLNYVRSDIGQGDYLKRTHCSSNLRKGQKREHRWHNFCNIQTIIREE